MNRKNLIPLLGIAFAVAVISTWIFYGLVAGRFEREAAATARTLVVAKRDLAAGITLTPSDLRSITWSGSDAPEGGFALTAEAVGGRLVSAVAENEPLTHKAVELSEGGSASATTVPVGMRAVSLRASDSLGLMHLLGRGSLVDIQSVSTTRDSVSVHTILERVPVVNLQKPGEDGLGKNEPAVVTVLVVQGEADHLALADSAGKIRLALRNPAEESRASKEASDLRVMAAAAAVAKTETQAVSFPVEVSLFAGTAGEAGIRVGEAPSLAVKGKWTGQARSGSAFVDGEMSGYRVRVVLRSARFHDGRYEAIVEPEISWTGATATEARRLSQTVAWKPNEKIVVRGLSTPDGNPAVVVIAAVGAARAER